ncbi:MAG: type I glyceraldehyde-3-phosphate dehydrogenase [Patescibacteria group bacterium]
MEKIRVGINGFGRIGRAFFRIAEGRDDIEVVSINDLGDVKNLAYLLAHDSVYKTAPFSVEARERSLMVNGREVMVTAEKDPAVIPWGAQSVAVVVESTGVFTDFEKAAAHLTGGAKRVVITAPVKGAGSDQNATVLVGVNEEKLPTTTVTSNASCTTNASSPVIAILDEAVGIDKALLNTVHAYTATQAIVDGPTKKGFREGRAAALNIIPSSTGAAIAVTQAYESLAGKFDGISIRVPVPAGSIADITFIAKRDTSVEEINGILEKAAQEPRWQGIFTVTHEELVSSDIVGNPHAAIADLSMTRVIGNLVKVLTWYDNEYGYASTLVRHVAGAGKHHA